MIKIFGAAVAAVTLAASASAIVTVTTVNGPDTPQPTSKIIYDFDTKSPTTGPGGQLQGDYGIVTGDSANIYAAPLGDKSKYLTVPLAQVPGTASLELGAAYKTVSFYWGSIDKYNSVSFYSGDEFLGSVGSGDLPALGDGNQGSAASNRRVTFKFDGKAADSIVISSRQYAFELDTITAGVPEPATWAMLVVGMGLVGSSMRRRRTVASVAA